LLRIDEEKQRASSHVEANTMRKRVEDFFAANSVDAMILQDYNKGFLSAPMIRMLLELAHKHSVPVCVDPKDVNFFEYEEATIFKPNLRELRERVPFKVDVNNKSLLKAAAYLSEDVKCMISAITLSEHGIFLSGNGESGLFPTKARTVVDVCGAGDAVIAVLALAHLMGASLAQMADLANTAGGVVCSEVGVCPVDLEKMKKEVC
jgi:rfaE bifunctional protein kinase chain/domain